MTVPASLWPEVSEGFDAILGLASEARVEGLMRLRTERPDVAVYVERLLDAHRRPAAADPLAAMPSQLLAGALAAHRPGFAAALQPGRMVGPYRLVAPLGEGGMASVWLADQTINVQRRVALKIPHLGLEDAAAAASRYARERDVLASLEHAHIARLYDAGVDADGLAYLAMEWIDGVSICSYADGHRLDIRARISLFQQVLEAVRFAHSRLVIHRDIKPSNILVTADGEVKLLDFGIAHLLEQPGASELGLGDARALTPECASPEQLAGGALGTASDVYSLGVVLYELLCGERPYRLEAASAHDAQSWLHALMRAVVRPPSRVAIGATAATARQATPRALQRQLVGDLDAIVLGALQKKSADRYSSVESLAAELDCWQRGLPVAARGAAPRYVAGRFLLRHRSVVAAAGAVALALALGFGLTAGTVISVLLALGLGVALELARRANQQARRARQEARRAQAVQQFLISLFKASDPEQARGRDPGARELLARGAKRLETELQDEPAVLARLHQEIGGIYIQLGSNVAARPHFERALALYRAAGLEGSVDAIDALVELAEVFDEEMDYASARPLVLRCVALVDRHHGPRNRWRLPLARMLAWMDVQEGRPQAAVDAMTAALAQASREDPRLTVETVKARGTLGNGWLELGRFAEAAAELSRSLREAATLPDYELTSTMADRYNLARARYNLREFEATCEELAVLVPGMDCHVGPQHDRTIKARSLWAQTLAELGQFDEAIEVQRANLEAAQARESLTDEVASLQKLTLGKLYKMAVRPRDGLPLIREGLAHFDAKDDGPGWFGEIARRLLGELLLQEGRVEAALSTFDLAAERSARIRGHATTTYFADLLQAQALALHVRGAHDDRARAIDLLATARAIFVDALGVDNLATLRSSALLAWLRALDAGVPAEADAAFTESASRYAALMPARHVAQAELQWMHATLERRRGRDASALPLEAAARSAWREAMGREFYPPLTLLH